MAFPREINTTKTGVADLEIRVFLPGPSNSRDVEGGELTYQVEISNGDVGSRRSDLYSRLNDDAAGQAHLSNLSNLLSYLRTRLDNEVLPIANP